jgi:cyclomaltodextrinase
MVEVLTTDGRGYHEDALVIRFLNNNDTGARFLTSYGIDFYRVALAMLLTLPGLPCIYTGDEVGAEYQPYEQDGIGPIDWTDRHGFRSYTKKLIAMRRESPALYSREWQPLSVDPAAPFFAYLRAAEGTEPALVILNFSGSEQEAIIELPPEISVLFAREPVDLWSGENMPSPSDHAWTVSVPAWSFRVVSNGQG